MYGNQDLVLAPILDVEGLFQVSDLIQILRIRNLGRLYIGWWRVDMETICLGFFAMLSDISLAAF